MDLQNKIKSLATELKSLRDLKKDLEFRTKEVNKAIKGYEECDSWVMGVEQLLYDTMDAADMTKASIKDVGTVYMHHGSKPSVTDQESLFSWMRENDFDAMIKETIHWQTLRSFVQERSSENLEMPPGVEVFNTQEVRIRKA